MDLDDIRAELGIYLTDMQNQPGDRHELYLRLVRRINQMRAFGMPIPEDFLKLECALEAEFAGDKRIASKA